MMRKVVEILASVPRTLEIDAWLSDSIRIWTMGERSAFSRPRLTSSTPPGLQGGSWNRYWAAKLSGTH
jgi:hypothetical protein